MAITLLACAAPGCYERVVSANGLGGSYAKVEPEYRSNTAADRAFDAMFSPTPPSKNRNSRFVEPNSLDEYKTPAGYK